MLYVEYVILCFPLMVEGNAFITPPPPLIILFLTQNFSTNTFVPWQACMSVHPANESSIRWHGINLLVRLSFQKAKSVYHKFGCKAANLELGLCKKLSKVTNFPNLVKSNIISSAWSSIHYHEHLSFTTRITQFKR